MNRDSCPKCGTSWGGGSILETFLKQRDEGSKWLKGCSDEQVEAKMKESYSPPYRWKREIGIEFLGEDKISQWKCPDCDTTFDRWTGKEII